MLSLKKLAPISAFEPFAPLTEMSNRYRALFGEPFADLFAPTGWVPPVEIAETEEKLGAHHRASRDASGGVPDRSA